MLEKVWSPRTLKLIVLEEISRRGALTDEELLKAVRDGKNDVSFRDLNKLLMQLEVTGLIRVSRMSKNKRHVELVETVETGAASASGRAGRPSGSGGRGRRY